MGSRKFCARLVRSRRDLRALIGRKRDMCVRIRVGRMGHHPCTTAGETSRLELRMPSRWTVRPISSAPKSARQPTAQQERELVEAWKRGDRRAGGVLVKQLLPFVVSIALEYRRWNAPLDDIVQQGCLGLLRAAARFDPAQNVRLVTYAAYWIRAEIRDYVLRTYRMVRVGTTKSERRALRLYRSTLETEPGRLALASGMTLRRAQALMPLLTAGDMSLEASAGEGATPYRDRFATGDPSPEERAIESIDGVRASRAILRAISELPSREQVIARERWLAESPATLQSLGDKLGVTKERVRQIEDRTREKIRARLLALKVA
jgi:RNA polymerase sigma-32 factor